MPHYRHVHFGYRLYDPGHPRAALELHGLCPAFFHEPYGVSSGVIDGGLVRAERHVGHDKGVCPAPYDCLGMIDYLVDRYGKRALVRRLDHAGGVAHYEQGYACLVQYPGCGEIIGRKDGYLPALGLHLHYLDYCIFFHRKTLCASKLARRIIYYRPIPVSAQYPWFFSTYDASKKLGVFSEVKEGWK